MPMYGNWDRQDSLERRIGFSLISRRQKWSLPGDSRVAVWVVPNIEHYEYLPAVIGPRDPWPRMPHPDVQGYGGRDYGNRVGLWRLFDVLDKYSIRCTVSLSMSVLEMYPRIFEAMESRGWEYMSHGLYNTRYVWGCAEDEERALVRHCADIHQRMTGRPLPGWFSPAVSCTLNTPDLVAEAGIRFYCDLYHDDQPTPVQTRHGTLVSVPYSMDLNDAMVYRQPVEGAEFERMIVDHFDTVYAEGDANPRVMCIALHPYMMGAPHRIRYLDRALAYICSHDKVWFATGSEIAAWYLQHNPDARPGGVRGGR